MSQTEEANFNPKLYTFRSPEKIRPDQTYSVFAPPFWVLVDHLLAVVWHLYSGESAQKVGIVHLQWASEFAKWIKDDSGTTPTAIKSLILVIEDALMDRYANLSKQRSKSSTKSLQKKDDEMNTSVTLRDVLARTAGISPSELTNRCGKKIVLSKASETPQRSSEQPAVPPENDVVGFLNYLKKKQEDKIKRESEFLDQLKKALEDAKSNNKPDLSKFSGQMED